MRNEYIVRARNKLEIAEHFAKDIYPVLKDQKLLLIIIENIWEALDIVLSAISDNQSFEKKMDKIKNIKELSKFIFLMHKINDILVSHRESPIEFARKDKIVICSANYTLKTIKIDDIDIFIRETKEFIDTSVKIVGEKIK